MIDAYPLTWPASWPREDQPGWSNFKTGLVTARRGLLRELDLLGATDVVISSNATLNRDGEIAARQGRIDDTGVAAYFTLDGQQRCIPCDKWILLQDNVHAIELAVAALRGLERWGAHQMVVAAFTGFTALPFQTATRADDPWWVVLGVRETASADEITYAYRDLAMTHHPDMGGDAAAFRQIHAAYEAGRAARHG